MGTHLEHARVFKAFCDEKRLMILEQLRGGELCACELLERLDMGQPNLSHHMKILCEAGIVKGRKAGKWMHYTIDEEGVRCVQELLGMLMQRATPERAG